MTIDDKIRDEKLQYDINRAAAKISALSSGKIYKYEDLTCEEILPSDQSRMIEQVNFPLANTLEKQITTMEDQAKKKKKKRQNKKKQVEALKVLKPVQQKFTIKDTTPEDRLKQEAKNDRKN